MSPRPLLATLVGLTLALPACGDDGGGTEGTSDASTGTTTDTSAGDTGTTADASTGDPTTDAPTTDAPTTTGDPAAPTFTAVYMIFEAFCTCHNNPAGAGGLSLEGQADAYANIVGVPSAKATMMNLIEPGDPTNSYLYLKLTGDYLGVPGGTGDPMPVIGDLTPEQLALVEQWIALGALND